jgi:hypothetical protein
VKFPTIGTTVSGRITRTPEARQQTSIETGEPLTFANGDPRMQIVVNLATAEREGPEDDGERALYVKAGMLTAVRDAVRKTGAKGLEVGGTLTITYVGDGEKKNKAFSAPKIYTAAYVAPTAQAANDLLMAGAPSAPPAASYVPPVHAAVVTQQPAAPAGVDPAVWTRMAPEQQQTVLAAMGVTPPF